MLLFFLLHGADHSNIHHAPEQGVAQLQDNKLV
jgi:hypothetical protein